MLAGSVVPERPQSYYLGFCVKSQRRAIVIIDARDVEDGSEIRSDLCIIGSGAAGIAIAHRLRDTGARVVLLESGGEFFDQRTQALYEGRSKGLPYFDLAVSRLRYFGGSTNHWGGTCRPFTEADFDDPPGGDVPGWPLELTDLAPYYDEAGRVCGLSRPVSELGAAESEDPTVPLPLDSRDFDRRYNQIVDGVQRSFAARYRDQLEASTKITVHHWANVTEILVDPTGSTVSGAAVATLTGVRYTVRSRVVVLATGGIENARLLLASTGVSPEGLGNRFGHVGRFFSEHPRFVAAHILPRDRDRTYEWYGAHEVNGIRYRGYAGLSPERVQDAGLTDVQLRLSAVFSPAFTAAIGSRDAAAVDDLVDWLDDGGDVSLGRDLLRISEDLTTIGEWFVPGGPLPVPAPDVLRRLAGSTPSEREALIPGLFGDVAAYLWERGISQPPVERVDVTARIAQVPNADSRVTLVAAEDELGVPRAELRWELSEVDRRSVTSALELFGAEITAAGLGRVRMLTDQTDQWPPDLRGGFHHMGTTRMSTEPEDGVVNRDCEVHSVENLYVAGSSVFSTAGSGTPTLTIVALALRLADHLVREVL